MDSKVKENLGKKQKEEGILLPRGFPEGEPDYHRRREKGKDRRRAEAWKGSRRDGKDMNRMVNVTSTRRQRRRGSTHSHFRKQRGENGTKAIKNPIQMPGAEGKKKKQKKETGIGFQGEKTSAGGEFGLLSCAEETYGGGSRNTKANAKYI